MDATLLYYFCLIISFSIVHSTTLKAGLTGNTHTDEAVTTVTLMTDNNMQNQTGLYSTGDPYMNGLGSSTSDKGNSSVQETSSANRTGNTNTSTSLEDQTQSAGSNDLDSYFKKKSSAYLTSRWLNTFVPVVYTMVFLIALPVNVMVVILFVFKVEIDKPAVVYLLNLALVDIFFACVLPLNIIYRFSGNNWVFGLGVCRFVISVFYMNMYCSILLLAMISVDKYMTVVYPIQVLSWCTVKRAWMICLCIWIISIASIAPILMTDQIYYNTDLKITTCHDVVSIPTVTASVYFTAYCSAFFFLPFIIIIFCYFVTLRCLRATEMDSGGEKKDVVIVAAVTFFAFFICFGPTNVLFLAHNLHIFGKTSYILYFVYIVSTGICSANCCLDVLLFYFVSPHCQVYMYSVLCCRISLLKKKRKRVNALR